MSGDLKGRIFRMVKKMKNKLDDLSLRFQTKGFMNIEIPGLIKDVFNIIGNDRYDTMNVVNQELEDLGWGIGIMDNGTYEMIYSLVENTNFSDVERHIRS